MKGLREANPDQVVMYYCLSPLFLEYFDLHSPDDLFMAAREYDVEANRRFFFSSLLGEIGMPTYGSGGYDWVTMPEIWFDSALIGTLGSLNSFVGDEQDAMPTPERIAKYSEGELVIQRSDRQASEASVTERYFGGNSKESRIEIRKGALRLPLRERDETGSPVEWIELNVRE